MNRQRVLALLFAFLCLSGLSTPARTQSASQWRALAPLEGGTVNALLEKDGVVYAGTATTGIFTSSDNGKTWHQAGSGVGNLTVSALAAAGSNVLAATNAGVYRSNDGGQSWTFASLNNQSVTALLSNSGNIFAGTNQGRIFFSSDEGKSWQERTFLPLFPTIFALAALSDQLFAGTSRGVFRSADQGQSWTPINTGLPNNNAPSVRTLTVSGTTLYLGTNLYRDAANNSLPQVYATTDNGQTWSAVGGVIRLALGNLTGLGNVNALAFDGTNLLAMTSFGVASYNGQTWEELPVTRGLPVGVGVNGFTRTGGTSLLGTTGGVFALAKEGASWVANNAGLTATNVNALAASDNTILASAGSSGFFRSSNDGQSWTAINSIGNGAGRRFQVTTLVASGNNFYAGISLGGGVFSSNDGGLSWTPINNGFSSASPSIADLAVSGAEVYAASSGFVYKLKSDGSGWTAITSASIGASRLAASGANLYVTTASNLLRSTDSGANFASANLGTTLSSTAAIAARGSNVYFSGVTAVPDFFPQLLRSTNDGASFTPSQSSFRANAFAFSANAIYASASVGVVFSDNNGLFWTPINGGLGGLTVNSLAVKGELVLAGTNGFGVFGATTPRPTALANTSAASFRTDGELAPESITTAFGTGLATVTQSITTLPLPFGLAGTGVRVLDSLGDDRAARLFYISPTQINYQLPVGTAPGTATVTIVSSDGSSARGTIMIAPVAPGLFAANQNGRGAAAAAIVFVSGTNRRSEPNAACDANGQNCVPRPIDLTSADEVFVELYGTGIRNHSGLANVIVTVGGEAVPVTFASAQPNFVGLDQVNIKLPRSLTGRGEVDVMLTVDGKTANPVRINIR